MQFQQLLTFVWLVAAFNSSAFPLGAGSGGKAH